jgi:hypothetical protein
MDVNYKIVIYWCKQTAAFLFVLSLVTASHRCFRSYHLSLGADQFVRRWKEKAMVKKYVYYGKILLEFGNIVAASLIDFK